MLLIGNLILKAYDKYKQVYRVDELLSGTWEPVSYTHLDVYKRQGEYNMKATIFAIGVSIGKNTYKDTDHAMTPHFGAAEMQDVYKRQPLCRPV